MFANSYLLQGSALAIGATIFLLSSTRGFRAGAAVVGTLGCLLLYLSELTLPTGFYDYVVRTVFSPWFAWFGGASLNYLLAPNTYYIFNDASLVFLATTPVALCAWAIRSYAYPSRLALATSSRILLTLSAFVFGIILVIVSSYAAVVVTTLSAFALTSPKLIVGPLGIQTIVSMCMAGLPVCAMQVIAGAYLVEAGVINLQRRASI